MERWQAIEELELTGVSFYDPKPEPMRKKLDPPSARWQEVGKLFVDWAASYLWSNASSAREALAYLRGRGLDDATIKRKKFGYCPLARDGRWYGIDPSEGALEHWGLRPEDMSEKIRERGTIAIPPGVIIPWYEQDILWKIAVRRLDEPDPDRRYRPVAGSVDALYNLDSIKPGLPIMLVEAEFCASAVEQAVPDLVSVIATGSDMKGRNPRFAPRFEAAPFVVQSFDDDEPGKNGARYWFLRYDRCFRHAPAVCKDPNDMLRAHGKLFVQEWVQLALDTWQDYEQRGIVPTLARV